METIVQDAERVEVEELTERLSAISQKTSMAALDKLMAITPKGDTGYAAAAATAKALAEHVTSAAEGLTGTVRSL